MPKKCLYICLKDKYFTNRITDSKECNLTVEMEIAILNVCWYRPIFNSKMKCYFKANIY